jgi:peptide/nickel transport system substrate-binding protein
LDHHFHNGQVLDAVAVKRSIDAVYQTGLTQIAMAPMYDHVEVSGPRSVDVYLKVPWAQYLWSLTTTYMMAPEMLDREDRGTVFPIGTGPFRFAEWVQGVSLKVTRWNDYWRRDAAGRPLPHLDQIEFRPTTDEDAREAGLVARTVDFALSTSPASATRLGGGGFTVLRDYTGERTFITLQTDESADNAPNPFTNVHARRALAHATDRASVARLAGDKVEVTTQGYRPSSKWGLPADQTGYADYDQDAARREIEAYERDTGRHGLTFHLMGLPGQQAATLLQAVRSQWKAVGIEADIEIMDQVPYSTTVVLGRFQAALFRWYGDPNPDANNWYNSADNAKPIGQLSLNFTHYRSEAVERNLHLGRQSTDFAVRKAANDAVVRETNDQAINIWLHDTPYAIITQSGVRGLNNFRLHPFGNFTSKPWWGDVWLQR